MYLRILIIVCKLSIKCVEMEFITDYVLLNKTSNYKLLLYEDNVNTTHP